MSGQAGSTSSRSRRKLPRAPDGCLYERHHGRWTVTHQTMRLGYRTYDLERLVEERLHQARWST